MPLSYAIGPFFVALLSLRHGEGGWDPFDRTCLVASGIGLALWGLLGSPLLAIAVNIAVDFAGALPTVRKTYKNPRSENRVAWTLFLISNAINCFAIRWWRDLSVVLPLYFFVMTALITALCFRRAPAA